MTHTSFIARCRALGINGGRNVFTEDALRREAKKGNMKAAELLDEFKKEGKK